MKIKDGYVINKLGDGYVVVTIGNAAKDFNGLIRLNDTGAFMWKSIQDGADTKEKLVDTTLSYYDGLDKETANDDVNDFLEQIRFALE